MTILRRKVQNDLQPRFDTEAEDDSFFWKSQKNFERRQSLNADVSGASQKFQTNQDAEMEPKPISPKQVWKARLVWLLTTASAGMATLGMIVSFNPVTAVASSAALVVAGTVAYKEHLLKNIPTLRNEINIMRELKTALGSGVDELSGHIDNLVEEKERLAPIVVAMSDIALRQEINVVDMVELVKRNEIQAAKMKKVLLLISIEEIIKIMLISDWNNNFLIDNAQERQFVTMRAEIKLTSMGIIFNKQMFEEEIRKHCDLATIIRNLRQTMEENEGPNRQIIACDANSLSSFNQKIMETE